MNRNKIFLSFLLAFFVGIIACEDDKELVPKWESAINGYMQVAAGSSPSFVFNSPSTDIDLTLRWISIDNKASVNKIDVYVLFDEPYIDKDGNPAIASHGGAEGKLLRSWEGDEVPGNREDVTFSLTQTDVYNLYQTATFDYDGTGPAAAISVFGATPNNAQRDATNRIVPGDAVTVRFEFTATDGRVFERWSPSVCTEFPGSNCELSFTAVCTSNLAGTYSYVTTNITAGPGGNAAGCGGSATGTGTLTALGGGSYSVSDATFGVFDCAWDDSPVTGVRLRDVCDDISFTGSDQYGDTYTLTVVSVTATQLTIQWVNTYGDGGRTVLTRTDAKTWPLTLK